MRDMRAKRKGGRGRMARHAVERRVIPGIVRDAAALGVSRFHLWAVLSGRRESDGLVRRYEELKEASV